VHARAWAEPEAMVGYVYRDTDERDLMVAQSDSGSAQLEVWTRKLPGAPWRLANEQRSAGGVAVEIHQHEALPGVSYLGWDAVAPASVTTAVREPPIAGAQARDPEAVPWPELGAIVALGLTYADHVRETGGVGDRTAPPSGGAADRTAPPSGGAAGRGHAPSGESAAPIAAFAKHARTFARDDGSYPVAVPTPTVADIAAALDACEAGLAARLPGAPAVMDYEGELALVALGPIDADALARGTPQPLGVAAANDLTARLVQACGEGQGEPYAYWAAAKSFARFLPVAPRVWAPAGGIAQVPELVIETRVNGERRQHASTRELIYDLPALVRAAAQQLGRPLARGDVVLTGTPAGVGLRLSPLQRKIAARIADRIRKAEMLVSSYAGSSALLRPGDVVEVDCGRAGRVRARLAV
jgi:2-keto-4-pentenoate hydratase/2-oxohepta-3-ene-1,7-dioic acid hydratase in catechol pathway